jgi:hypothetical protein
MKTIALAAAPFLLAMLVGCGSSRAVPAVHTVSGRPSRAAPAAHTVSSGHVYWVNDGDGTVNEVPVGGGKVTTLSRGNQGAVSLAVGRSHLYWAGGLSGITKVPLGGGKATALARGHTAVSVAVDSRKFYWVESVGGSWQNAGGKVNEVPLGGGHVTNLASDYTLPRSVAVDGRNVYWAWVDSDGCNGLPHPCGEVMKTRIGGGPLTTIASNQDSPISVAVSGGRVYWLSRLQGTVNEVSARGGRVTTLARGQNGPVSLAVNGTHVVWVNYYDGTVNAIPVGGGKITTLAHGQDSPSSVAVDDSHVYWTTSGHGGTVNEISLKGGRATVLARGQNDPGSIAVGPYRAKRPPGSAGPTGAIGPAGMTGPTPPAEMIGPIGEGPTGQFGPTGDYGPYGSTNQWSLVLVPRIGPVLLSSAGLAAEERLIGQRIYWAGPKQGFSYEFTRDTRGDVYVRYLPKGVRNGAPGSQFLIVATYPFDSAYGALKQSIYGENPFFLPGRSLVYATPDDPKSALIAFRGNCPKSTWGGECGPPYQIEVYDPAPAVSARVAVVSGEVKVTPVS